MSCQLEPLDPHERKFYQFDFTAYLAGLGDIAAGTMEPRLDDKSIEAGVAICGGNRAPSVAGGVVSVALEVGAAARLNPLFDDGHTAHLEITFDTTAVPSETLQFVFQIRVRQAG